MWEVSRRLLFAVLHTIANTSLLAVLAILSCQVFRPRGAISQTNGIFEGKPFEKSSLVAIQKLRTWPGAQMLLVEGLLGLAALVLSFPEAVGD